MADELQNFHLNGEKVKMHEGNICFCAPVCTHTHTHHSSR